MSYLVLHIDVEFIVGAVCADNGTSSPILNGKEDLLWLYFFNNPHQNSITFGRDNKTHFNNSEVNHYGKFFEEIEREQITFTLRGIEHPIIDLFKESGLLETVQKTYLDKTLDNTENIPTLITFSSSIGNNAKQKTINYLKKQGFQIDSYTIPLAELTAYNALNNKAFKVANGSVAIFLEATNSTLHLMKLSFSDNYFLIDNKVIASYDGKGFDPRKQALLRFIVNEANKAIGVLFSEKEKIEECKRLEMKSDEWLKKLDATSPNMPYNIRGVSFSKMPNSKKDVLVRKSDLESDMGNYIQELKDIFDDFRHKNVQGDMAAVFLLGDCFKSDRVKNSFEQITDKDKLYFYSNKDIRNILAMYPKIDITRYANEEERIKERAKAEEHKQAEQRALEDKQRKEKEEDDKRQAEVIKTEQNRKNAQKLFEKAIELEKKGQLEDARVNVENAVSLDKTNREYGQFLSDLIEKINNLNAKNELYKSYLSKADKSLANDDLEKTLEYYEAAKFVFDNAEIIQKIIEVKRLIKNKQKQKEKIEKLLSEANHFVQNRDFQNANSKLNEIISIDKVNTEANLLLSEIDQFLKQQEKQFNDFVKSADKFFNAGNYEEATNNYNQALTVKPDDNYCLEQLDKIAETIKQQKENLEKCEKITAKADELFQNEKWTEAQTQYQLALNLCPQNKDLQGKINQCNAKIKAQENALNDLLMQATVAEKKGKWREALEALESALRLQPDDTDIKKRIKKIKFNFGFEDSDITTSTPKSGTKNEDAFVVDKKQKETQKTTSDDGDFLGTGKSKTPKTTNDDNDFLGSKNKSTSINKTAENDFLEKKQKKSSDDDDNNFLNLKK
jgi:tetratricopeptide (TPR) repeat protein